MILLIISHFFCNFTLGINYITYIMRKILFVLLSAFCLHATAQQVDATLLRIVRENAKTVKTGKVRKAAGQKKGVQPVTVVDRRTGEKTVLDFKHEVNGVDTMQLKEMYELSFNADGSIRNCTVIGTLRDGATVPAERLVELGVRVDAVIDKHVLIISSKSMLKLGLKLLNKCWVVPSHVRVVIVVGI